MDLLCPTHLLLILLNHPGPIFGSHTLGDVAARGHTIRYFKRARTKPAETSKTFAKPDEAKPAKSESPPYKDFLTPLSTEPFQLFGRRLVLFFSSLTSEQRDALVSIILANPSNARGETSDPFAQ